MPDLISILDTEYRIVRANRAMAARLGMTPEECVGLTCYRVIHGTDEPPSFCPHRQLLKDGLEHTEEVCEDSLGGDFIVSVSPLHDSEGKLTGCIHLARDITKRKRAEEALRQSEERLRFALETSHTGAWDLDLVDHTAYRSLEHDRIFGYEQLLPQWTYEMFLDHVLPEDREMVDAKFRKATTALSDWSFECRIRRVDGEVRWIWAAGRHSIDATGNMRRMAGIVQDITERKRLEEQTRRRAEEMSKVMEVAPVAIFIGHDPQSHNITGNRMANELYEAEAGENVSANAIYVRRLFCKGREITADELPMQKAALKDIEVRDVELDMLLPSGKRRVVLGSASPLHDTDGHVRGSIGAFMDITERKRMEEELHQSEERLQVIIANSPDIIFEQDRDLRYIWVFNPTSPLSASDVLGKTDSELLPPDQAQLLTSIKRRVLDTGMREQAVLLLTHDGESRWFEAVYEPRYDAAGQVIGILSYTRDITERKQAEEALRESEEKYRNLIETATEGIWILDAEARTTYVNEKMAEMLGYSQEEMIDRFAWDFADEEGKAILKMNMEKRRQGINETYEFKLMCMDGSPLWVLISAKSFFNKDSKFTGSLGMFTDITKRKEAENALKKAHDNLENLVIERTAELEKAYKSLKESEKGLAEAQKMAHIGNWDWNIVTNEIYCSDELYRIFELNPQEISANYEAFFSYYVHPDDRDYVDNAVKRALKGEPYSIDNRIITANGEERTVHAQTEVIFDEKNNPVRMRGTVQDITERKKAEQALELSEEMYRIVTEQTGQLVYDYDIEEDTTDWAGNIKEITGFTPNEFESMSLKFWLCRIHPEDLDRYLENFDKYMRSGDTYRTEYRIRKKNEEYIYFEDNGICLIDGKGNVHRILGVLKDITERKQSESFLANIETARKKEIHHRIKNNLQVISSLLDLQAEKFRDRGCVEDSEVLKAFRESQDRVMSIALIHEELHEGRGTNTLNFSPYLEKLVKNLFQTYRLGNANTSLNIDLEENVFFDMDIAVPLGIIINELVSNSLKYAFPDKDKGLIQIKLCREESAECANNIPGSTKEGCNGTNFSLTVSDNGVGMPERFNSEKSETLGLELVMILVDQLGGKLELKKDPGTEFVIRFTVAEKK